MKTAVIFADGIKQIVFTPESKSERYALSLITEDDDIELLIRNGSVGEKRFQPFTANIGMCCRGYLRIFGDRDSKILVLRSRENKS